MIELVTAKQVTDRLKQFGYEVTENENSQVDFELNLTIEYVKNYCNITTIPTILDNRIIDKVAALYLFNRKNSGKLEGFDYESVIKQIKEGDTTVQYAVGQGEDTPENRFDSFVKQLERGFDKWLTPHRALRW